MSDKKFILGAGGGGASTPDRTDDNLFSEDVVEFALAVSEGPIRGLTNGAKSFFVGDTALVAESGGLNFSKFAIGVYPGYSEESSKPLALQLGGVTSNDTINVELQQGIPVTRQTSSTLRNVIDELEVRIYFANLVRVDGEGGTHYNNAIFSIEYKKASDTTWVMYTGAPLVINGKTSSGYAKDFPIPVPRVNEDWVIRVTKFSVDNSETDVVKFAWESLQSTTKGSKKFPWVAIVHGIGVSDGQFSSIPQFSGVYDGMLVRVPTNYNADLRTYDESVPWNGAFKFAWTNNNAWILYHLLVDTRTGMAAHYPYLDVNRFDFYEAGKWCDTPVTAGSGTQPRFTFNSVLTEPRNALEMLAYVAGSFNSLLYDDFSGQVHLRVDRDEPAGQMFTPENVSSEGFTYSFTEVTSRVNDISVTFVNPNLDWNEDRRRIPGVTTDETAIGKVGRIPMDFVAVGCTDEYEAIRRARHRLVTAQTEVTIINFTTTRIGVLTQIYDVILVADPIMGWSQPGRILTYDTEYVYLGRPIFIEVNEPHVMKIQTLDGVQEVIVIPEEIGYVNRLVLSQAIPTNTPEQSVFTIEQANGLGFAKPFRVTSIEAVDGSPHAFRISAIEINRAKYLDGDEVGEIPEFQYSFKQPLIPNQPNNLTAQSGDNYAIVAPSGEVTDRIYVAWRVGSLSSSVTGFEIRWRRTVDDSEWETLNVLAESAFLSPVLPGVQYTIQVRSVLGATKSSWVTVSHTVNARSIMPDAPVNFTAIGGLLQAELTWEYGQSYDYKLMEIWGGPTSDTSSFVRLADIAYPQNNWTHLGMGVGVHFYYRIRGLSKTNAYSPWSVVIHVETESQAGPFLELLTGQIAAEQLTEDLLEPIQAAALKARVFRQNTAPTADNTGDVWYDSSDNLLYYSEQFDQAAWVKLLGTTVTVNGATAPDASVTADILNFPATANTRVEQQTGLAVTTGETWTFSVWLRGSGTISIAINTQNGVGGPLGEVVVTLSATWTRFSCTAVFPAGADTARAMVIKRTTDTATTVAVWGAQLEKSQAQPGRYVKREGSRGPVPINWVHYWNGTEWVQSDNATIASNSAAIISEQAARISGDETNATLITSVQAIASKGINLLNSDGWLVGATSATGWAFSGTFGTQLGFSDGLSASGSTDVQLGLVSTAAGAIGWNGSPTYASLDRTKKYRIVVPVKAIKVGCKIYLGVVANSVCNLNTTTANSNPYFLVAPEGTNWPLNEWCYLVAYVFPANSTGKSHSGAAIYRASTGEALTGYSTQSNYCWHPTNAIGSTRFYQIDDSGSYDNKQFVVGRPMWHLCDGSEPPLENIFSTSRGASALVQTEATARADADTANANLITTVQSALSNASGNRISNSSFEVDSNADGWADGYAVYNNSSAAYTVELATGRNGGKCQRVNFTGSSATTMGIAPVPGTNRDWVAGKTYVVSFYAKGYTGQTGRVMALYWNTNPSSVVALSNPPLSATEWQRYVFRVTWGASVEASGRLYISSITGAPSRTGALDFDDIQVEEGSYVTSYIPSDGATALAAVQTEATTRANADNAINSGLAAMYTIKTSISVDGRTYMSGIGVGVNNSTGVVESTILLAASKVAIIDPNTAGLTLPFVVTGGNVFINSALIADASITNAKIGNIIESVTYEANVKGWRLNKDGTGQIGGVIFDATGIQSYNYVVGVSGFRINRSGAVEFSNIKARGDIEATSIKADVANIVKTLHLENNAVTIPISAYWTGNNSTQHSPVTVTPSADFQGQPIVIIAQVTTSSNYLPSATVKVYRNGTLIHTGFPQSQTVVVGEGFNGYMQSTVLFIDKPPSGVYSYGVGQGPGVNGNSPSVVQASIVCIGCKK